MLNTRYRTYTCPFCLHSFEKDDVIIENPDPTDGERLVNRCPNLDGNETTFKRKCGEILPYDFFEAEIKIVSLTGGRAVGKSHFLVALYHLFTEGNESPILNTLGISGHLIGSKLSRENLDHRYSKLRVEGSFVLGTTIKESGIGHVFKINLGKQGKSVYLSFFDNTGELFGEIETIASRGVNIYKADSILYFFEPMQFTHLQADVLKSNPYVVKESEDSYYPDDIIVKLDNVISTIKAKKANRYRPQSPREVSYRLWLECWLKDTVKSIFTRNNKKADIPFGLVLSKIDQIESKLTCTIPSDILKGETLDFNDIDSVSQEIKDLIFGDDIQPSSLNYQINNGLNNYTFLGFNSIVVDRRSGKYVDLQPKGISLVLLWLLSELKLYINEV